MLIDPAPATGIGEVVHDLGRCLEGPVAVVQRHTPRPRRSPRCISSPYTKQLMNLIGTVRSLDQTRAHIHGVGAGVEGLMRPRTDQFRLEEYRAERSLGNKTFDP